MSFLYLSYSVHVCMQSCSLAGPGDPWCLTFALGQQENLSCFIQIIMLGILDFTVSSKFSHFSLLLATTDVSSGGTSVTW